MNTYLVAHYGHAVPTFSYAKTLDEACSCALSMSNSQNCGHDDILSIVNIADDTIVCYGKRDELINKFNAIGKPTTNSTGWSISLKLVLNWIGLKLAGPSVG